MTYLSMNVADWAWNDLFIDERGGLGMKLLIDRWTWRIGHEMTYLSMNVADWAWNYLFIDEHGGLGMKLLIYRWTWRIGHEITYLSMNVADWAWNYLFIDERGGLGMKLLIYRWTWRIGHEITYLSMNVADCELNFISLILVQHLPRIICRFKWSMSTSNTTSVICPLADMPSADIKNINVSSVEFEKMNLSSGMHQIEPREVFKVTCLWQYPPTTFLQWSLYLPKTLFKMLISQRSSNFYLWSPYGIIFKSGL